MSAIFAEHEIEELLFDSMPTNQERLAGIESRLDRIERTLHISPITIGMRLRSAWNYVKARKTGSLLVGGLLVAVLTLGYMVYSDREKAQKQHEDQDFDLRVGKIIDDRVGVQLADLSKQVAEIEGELKRMSLNRLVSADQETFAASLPELKRAMAQPVSYVSRNTLETLAEKLRKTPESSPAYWPTVLQFLQFASSGIPGVPPHGSMLLASSTGGSTLNFGSQVLTGVSILVDGGNLIGGKFVRSRIILTDNPVHMENVTFIDCLFELPAVATPNPSLKNFAQVLLASNLKAVTVGNIPSGGPT